jgi:uncharacterized protein DUF955
VAPVNWTHPSVKALLHESGAQDPYAAMEDRARRLTLSALERGWKGPPYDPFFLADALEIETVARQDLEDARLVPIEGEKPRIEFNPNRRPARIRFSVAHELGHLLLSDFAEQVRYRDRSHGDPGGTDDWQLESVCNVAAAELLMPAGAFPLSSRGPSPHPGPGRAGRFVLRGSEEIRGTVKRLDSEEVVMETSAGDRRARIAEIQDVLMHLESPGPE